MAKKNNAKWSPGVIRAGEATKKQAKKLSQDSKEIAKAAQVRRKFKKTMDAPKPKSNKPSFRPPIEKDSFRAPIKKSKWKKDRESKRLLQK